MPRTRTRIADQLLKTLEEIEKEELITDANLQNSNGNHNNHDHRTSSRHRKSTVIKEDEEQQDSPPPLDDEPGVPKSRPHRQHQHHHHRSAPTSRSYRKKQVTTTDRRSSKSEKSKTVAMADPVESQNDDEDLSVVAEQLKVIQESQDALLADIRLDMEQLQLDNQALREENSRLMAEKNHWESLYREMCQNTKTMREHVNTLQKTRSSRDTHKEPSVAKSDSYHNQAQQPYRHDRRRSEDAGSSRERNRSSSREQLRSEKKTARNNNPHGEDNPEETSLLSETEWEQRLPAKRSKHKRPPQTSQINGRTSRTSSVTSTSSHRSRAHRETKNAEDEEPFEQRGSYSATPDAGSVSSSQMYVSALGHRESSRSKDGQGGCFGFLKKSKKRRKHKKHRD